MQELKDTIQNMVSEDYKERFKAEYYQTKIRYEKLRALTTKIEAAERTETEYCRRPAATNHVCPLGLLREQQYAMGEYLHCLEIRAVIEGVEL